MTDIKQTTKYLAAQYLAETQSYLLTDIIRSICLEQGVIDGLLWHQEHEAERQVLDADLFD